MILISWYLVFRCSTILFLSMILARLKLDFSRCLVFHWSTFVVFPTHTLNLTHVQNSKILETRLYTARQKTFDEIC